MRFSPVHTHFCIIQRYHKSQRLATELALILTMDDGRFNLSHGGKMAVTFTNVDDVYTYLYTCKEYMEYNRSIGREL